MPSRCCNYVSDTIGRCANFFGLPQKRGKLTQEPAPDFLKCCCVAAQRQNSPLEFHSCKFNFENMAREIERRFLVRDVRVLDGRTGERIVQGYVAKETGSMSTRVRIRAGRAYLTLKSSKEGFSRDEFEYAIPLADAQAMIDHHCAGRIVRKTRYLIDHAHHVFEVDVFEGPHTGLIVAEVELPHEDTPLSLPVWVGEEVTLDSRYSNFTLATIESGVTGSALSNLLAAPENALPLSLNITPH